MKLMVDGKRGGWIKFNLLAGFHWSGMFRLPIWVMLPHFPSILFFESSSIKKIKEENKSR